MGIIVDCGKAQKLKTMKALIKYQWTAKQQEEVLAIIQGLKQVVYQEEIWSQIENIPQHDKHEVRCRLEGLIARVKKMRKITEEY